MSDVCISVVFGFTGTVAPFLTWGRSISQNIMERFN